MSLTIFQKQQRLGKFNASTVEALLKPKGLGEGGLTYIYKKAAETLTGEPQEQIFVTPAMQWGIDNEQKALDLLQVEKNDNIFFNDEINLSGTPDAMGYEIKCPTSFTHLFYLKNIKDADSLKKVEPKYYWQCISYMYLLNLNSWQFVSFDPRFEKNNLHIVSIDPLISEMEFFYERLLEAKKIYLTLV